MIDHLHALYSREPETFTPSAFTFTVKAMHFYDSIAIIETTMPPNENLLTCVPRQAFSGRSIRKGSA